jgi:hypothetical protein
VWVPAWNDGDSDIAAEWYVITPTVGLIMYVEDEEKWFFYNQMGAWQQLWDPLKQHRPIPREFSFYNPYLVRPRSIIFSYVATQEFVIEAGAPGSGAFCELPPSGEVIFNIIVSGDSVGSITFNSGSIYGTVSIPNEVVVLPTIEENMYERANLFSVNSPMETKGMEGLNVTIVGKIRSID